MEMTIGDRINDDDTQLRICSGYDHNYVLDISGNVPEQIAILCEENSGRRMSVYTDLPGMQFYAGNFISGKDEGKGGYVYKYRGGACFESQFFPDACNAKEGFKSSVFKAGQEYETTTIYKFDVE